MKSLTNLQESCKNVDFLGTFQLVLENVPIGHKERRKNQFPILQFGLAARSGKNACLRLRGSFSGNPLKMLETMTCKIDMIFETTLISRGVFFI